MSRLQVRLVQSFVLAGALAIGTTAEASEIAPVQVVRSGVGSLERYSQRTLAVGILVDRDNAELVAFTVKERPFDRTRGLAEPRASSGAEGVQLEVVLLGPREGRYTQRIDLRGLCLDHPAETEPHIEGDTIKLHRETFLVEVPEIPGFDRIEIAHHRGPESRLEREVIGGFQLAEERFTRAGGGAWLPPPLVAKGGPADGPSALFTLGQVHWPEEYGDPDIYAVFGDAAESDRRVNIVIVPDGYVHAEKALMQTHAQDLVDFFGQKTPYMEHGPFINYILVYAYSNESGTDQCDCSIVRDTAMNTRFPNAGYPCGNSGNRCLYYGTGNGGPSCDPTTTSANILAAELRAPAQDRTIVMVNTARYGGCGGSRAVYSAANASATEIAAHELGHSLAGLADEYQSSSACGSSAGEVNTSLDATVGAWPEWVPEIGPPVEGAQYYSLCIYRPALSCDMRALGYPFCPVCDQQFALTFFGHPRVAPTAPVASSMPSSPVAVPAGLPVDFSIASRLAVGTTNSIIWSLLRPGDPAPTIVATGTPNYSASFAPPGAYTVSCDVTADTDFIKPEKTGANEDIVTWDVQAAAIPEVSADSAPPLTVDRNGNHVDMTFEDTGAGHYNLYVSSSPATGPFLVADPLFGKKDCALAAATALGDGRIQVLDYDLEVGIVGPTSTLYFLVTADNGPQTEGTLGRDSSGQERSADAYCQR